MTERRQLLADARKALHVEHVVLTLHDPSFPSRADEETGRGSPYTRGAHDLYEWALDQGFTGVQLGPQGETSRTNPSPYDGTTFAKSVHSIALWRLAHEPEWEGILSVETLDAIVRGAPATTDHMDYAYVYDAHRRAVREAYARASRTGPLWARFIAFREHAAAWLDRDAQYEAWTAHFGTDDWQRWPTDLPDIAGDELFAFGQFLVHAQHAALVTELDRLGLRLFGDLQVGISYRDRFRRTDLFLPHYVMGAPASRTNPEGQPWGYPVLRPGSTDALALLRMRATKMLEEFHGVRIDHPHGLVCPWVYDGSAADPMAAVNAGARLFESPDLPDHPDLARFAIARADQSDPTRERYADEWVTSLDEAQIDAYARQFEVVMTAARAHGRSAGDILFEVLSTCPHPLEGVMRRYGLGRFRVTQKADPAHASDGYLTTNAEPGDWVMLGNHDTLPIWRVVPKWSRDRVTAWERYLGARLGPVDPSRLPQALFADLFASKAGHVSVFFADLLGVTDVYNEPGVVNDRNWRLRVGNDFVTMHARRLAEGHALDVPRAMATALRATGREDHAALADRLEHLDHL